MAKIAPPKKSSGKGAPPRPEAAAGNLDKADPKGLTPMNFKVTEEFHREFKTYAAAHGLSMVEVLRQSFEALKLVTK